VSQASFCPWFIFLFLFLFSVNWSENRIIIIMITRESTRRAQVPPPRQSYSPGGVTIFALPAVRLCPLLRNGNENFKMIQNPGFLPDHAQNWITGSLCHARHTLKISERSVHNFSSYLAHTQTDRQTNRQRDKKTKFDKNITSLAEVINFSYLCNNFLSNLTYAQGHDRPTSTLQRDERTDRQSAYGGNTR